MGKNANFVSHKKSKLKNQDGSPQLPSASALVEGEIAINFAENVETLSIKNESGDVVTFSSDNYYTEKKLGSGFTGENSAVTVTEALDDLVGSGFTSSSITDVIIENEEIVSAALTDLDERKLDTSAYTPSNYYTKSETSGATEISTALNLKTNASDFNTHTGNTSIHHTHSNKSALDAITGNVGTMAYENKTSYSSATEVNTALDGKSDTGHTHAIGDITNLQTTLDSKANTATTLAGYGISDAYTKDETSGKTEISNALDAKVNTSDIISTITPSNSGSTAPIATKVVAENELTVSNALNDLNSNKADKAADLDNVKIKKITQSAYDALVQAGTVDSNTLYFIYD